MDAAKEWLPIAIKEIQARIHKLHVESTGELLRSLSGNIQELSGGDAYKAEILHNYYGIFPDMGVGKGQSLGEASANKLAGGGRKRKPWTRAIAAQGHRFGEIMASEFANATVDQVKDAIVRNVIINT